MKYYALMAKEEDGCPAGFYSAYLVPAFTKDVEESEFGLHPWYAGPNRIDQPIRPFPANLALITKISSYSFDIKSGSRYFYVASERFVRCLEGLRTNFLQVEQVDYLDYSGAAIDTEKYFVVRTRKVPKADALNLELSLFRAENPRQFERIAIDPSMDLDVFDIAGLSPNQITLACSQKAKDAFRAAKIRGVEFVEIDQIQRTEIHRSEIYVPPTYPDPI